MLHACGNKGCSKGEHLLVGLKAENAEHEHCHFFIDRIICKHGEGYQQSQEFKAFKSMFCPHGVCI